MIEDGAGIGIDEDQHFGLADTHRDARRAIGTGGCAIGDGGAAGHGFDSGGDDRRRRQPFGPGRHDVAIGEDGIVDLVVEEIEATGDGQADHERDDEQAGKEVPAPDGAIEGNAALGGDRLRCGAGKGCGCHGFLREIRIIAASPRDGRVGRGSRPATSNSSFDAWEAVSRRSSGYQGETRWWRPRPCAAAEHTANKQKFIGRNRHMPGER
ncbi:hypothetical protein D9M72_474520 [compost metagenome]